MWLCYDSILTDIVILTENDLSSLIASYTQDVRVEKHDSFPSYGSQLDFLYQKTG